MTLLTILLIAFFSSTPVMNAKLSTGLTLVLVILTNYFINRKLLAGRTRRLLNQFADSRITSIKDHNKPGSEEWKIKRKEVSRYLKNILHGYITIDFIECFTMISIISGKLAVEKESEIGELYRDHILQRFIEAGINFLTALPFFFISILFTSGYKYEIKILSVLMALIFYLFIRSAIISPVFSLITLNKSTEKLKD